MAAQGEPSVEPALVALKCKYQEQLCPSPSIVKRDERRRRSHSRDGPKDHVTPRAVTVEEIPGIVADYKRAAENAIAVGFDGVEIHAANGYFLEQFLCDGVNKRIDKYGGSIKNLARIIFEVVDAILSSLPSSQVGIRLSPYGDTFACKDSTPAETYGYVVNKLNDYDDLAYVNVIERREIDAANVTRNVRDA
ncbi:hypothetical protein PC121_g8950 [Phytophthora cactorum]|nr:hypothetical protein PC121_g8950 [Phytophthora cactorum]KAG4057430.1 hypothetical protein PC123_g7553 [Phytophthora cactorum]